VSRGKRKEHIDLRRVQQSDLVAAGLLPAHIDVCGDCTVCDTGQRFFSFRKAGRATGQMVGFVVRADAEPDQLD
jgi:copper oxidase (laccase) domain-containing protein